MCNMPCSIYIQEKDSLVRNIYGQGENKIPLLPGEQ